MNKMLILSVLLILASPSSGISDNGCPLTHITMGPEGIQAAHYCYWEEQLFVMLARNWHGNQAVQIYPKEDARLMDRAFVSNLGERFEKRGWGIQFKFSDPNDYSVTVTISRMPEMQIAFNDYMKGVFCSHIEKKTYVIRDNEQLGKMWEKFGANMLPPEVDFSKNMIVAVFAGQFKSGGHSVTIEKITETKNGLNIHVKTENPGTGAAACVFTQPFYMVTCLKIDKPERFIWMND
ncbi:MAG: protease complex subunit PrcB family protein [Candidatus Woesearchaeota archaeon]